MVTAYLSAVNQKLLFARQLLSRSDDKKSQQQAAAIAQSVAVQLYQAWHWHCRNIAENYKLQQVDAVDSANSLVTLLAEQGKTPGEATEMQTLENDPHSWLNELLNAHRCVYQLPTIRKAEMDMDRLPVIAVGVPDQVDWSLESARLWYNRMQELIERHREMMVEF